MLIEMKVKQDKCLISKQLPQNIILGGLLAVFVVLCCHVNTDTDAKNEIRDDNKDESKVKLESWCYDPHGGDCRWYSECLAKMFPCQQNPDSYAIGYGDNLCNLITSSKINFSAIGQRWVDSTRACLQKALVPILSTNLTCPEIQTMAFETHSTCYTESIPGSPTFCDLPFKDWLRIAWIVKQSVFRETMKSLKQVISILGSCAYNGIANIFG